MRNIFFALIVICALASCSSVESLQYYPKFSSVDKVTEIKQGMTKAEVDILLGVKNYNVKEMNEDGTYVLLYKFRVLNRAISSQEALLPTNGKDAWGSFQDLFVTFGKDNKVIGYKNCIECGKVESISNAR